MTKTEVKQYIAGYFFYEKSKARQIQKATEVLDGIDHKRPFALVIKGREHVEILQVKKPITSPQLDEMIERVEKNKDGLWRYFDGKGEFFTSDYEQILRSFQLLRQKLYGDNV